MNLAHPGYPELSSQRAAKFWRRGYSSQAHPSSSLETRPVQNVYPDVKYSRNIPCRLRTSVNCLTLNDGERITRAMFRCGWTHSLFPYGVANCAINVSNLRYQKHILDPFEMHILCFINVSIVIASIHILEDLQNKKS